MMELKKGPTPSASEDQRCALLPCAEKGSGAGYGVLAFLVMAGRCYGPATWLFLRDMLRAPAVEKGCIE